MSCTKQFYYLHIGSFKFIAYIGETNNKRWIKPRLNIRLKDNIFPKFNCSVVTVVCVFKVWSRAIFFLFNLNRETIILRSYFELRNWLWYEKFLKKILTDLWARYVEHGGDSDRYKFIIPMQRCGTDLKTRRYPINNQVTCHPILLGLK